MKYYLFIDESGDHGLKTIDPSFPTFALCGILMSFDTHKAFVLSMYDLKNKFWNTKEVIFHSRDIRRCEKEFSILFNMDIKRDFYNGLSKIISETDYTILSAVINKSEYIKKYGKTGNVYSIALNFILERAVYFLDTKSKVESLSIIVEKRGKIEDLELSKYYNAVRSNGTGYVEPSRMSKYGFTMRFKAKSENINGLQLADLIAYPIANHCKNPERANPAFDIIKDKFYANSKGDRYGLKKYP